MLGYLKLFYITVFFCLKFVKIWNYTKCGLLFPNSWHHQILVNTVANVPWVPRLATGWREHVIVQPLWLLTGFQSSSSMLLPYSAISQGLRPPNWPQPGWHPRSFPVPLFSWHSSHVVSVESCQGFPKSQDFSGANWFSSLRPENSLHWLKMAMLFLVLVSTVSQEQSSIAAIDSYWFLYFLDFCLFVSYTLLIFGLFYGRA